MAGQAAFGFAFSEAYADGDITLLCWFFSAPTLAQLAKMANTSAIHFCINLFIS
ncbi:hypothetical protein [Propionispira raffinosivorans]|uniref:hypothetical protein n=1 Tax=Propionispira raffinosivorans TaxID=86959 RepID=UPI001B7FB875|nr:hypothetical protein [Propionispira raffinosivorans]